MKNSSFQFTNPQLVRLQFTQTENFTNKDSVNVNIQFSVDVQKLASDSAAKHEEARVSVSVRIGDTDGSAPFCLEAEEAADFRWEPGAYDSSQVNALLHQNGVALLISYLRPIIANVTAASKYGSFHLPFLNLTSTPEND